MPAKVIEILSSEEIRRTLTRLASEIIEKTAALPPAPVFEADHKGFRGVVPLSRSDVLCAELSPISSLPDFISCVDHKRLALVPAVADGNR